jgi:restriction system protein
MRRRKETWIDMVLEFPWWVIVIMSAIVFLSFKYWVPTWEFTNPFFKGMAKATPSFAPYAAGILLLLAAKSAYDSWRKGELLDSQRSIETIRSITWREFEELVGEVYRRKGFNVTEYGGGGADGGVDLVLKKGSERIFVQCKHWKMDVGVKIARELYGVMTAEQATGGIIISSGKFTQEAKDFIKGKPLEMIDGEKLSEMISQVKTSPNIVGKIDTSPKCPLCGSDMILRTAKRGANFGERFWGCSTFPKCRGIKAI